MACSANLGTTTSDAGTLALTGSSRNAILAIIAFFVVGGGLLAFVNVPEGQRLARQAERTFSDVTDLG